MTKAIHPLAASLCGTRTGFSVIAHVLLLVVALFVGITSASAADEAKKSFDIPAGTAPATLKEFSSQAGGHLLYTTKTVEGVTTQAVKGEMTAREALERMLMYTPLVAVADGKNGALSVVRDDPEKAKNVSRAIAESSGRPNSRSRDEATDGEGKPIVLDTFEVFGRKTLNMDVQRTRDDVQPYQIIDAAQIERSGASSIEDFLKQGLPMNTLAQTNAQTFGINAGTTSRINLRGLGANETLVLIDGRRTASVTILGVQNQPDINGIPLSAIERIEVLPSSASAIYGGAAIGGVVNIVLKRNYNVVEVGYRYNNTTEGDAPIQAVNLTAGFSLLGGKTQVLINAEYSDARPVSLGSRLEVFSKGPRTVLQNDPTFFYSPTNPFRGAATNIASISGNLRFDNGTDLPAAFTSLAPGIATGTDLTATLTANAGTYNLNFSPGTGPFGLRSPFGSVQRTKAAFLTVRHEFNPRLQVFVEMSRNDNEGSATSNPFAATSFLVSGAAPTNPFQQNVRVSFPSDIAAPRSTLSRTERVSMGLIATLSNTWGAELDYTWSRNRFQYDLPNLDTTTFNAALNNGTVNPFVDTLLVPPDLARYLTRTNLDSASTLNDIGLRLSGKLMELPAGTPTINIGLGYRKEGNDDASFSTTIPVAPERNGSRIYFAQSQSISSVYFESAVPVFRPAVPSLLLGNLSAQVAGRYERYTTSNNTPFVVLAPASQFGLNPPQGVHVKTSYDARNYTLGLKYDLPSGITLRTSYGTAFLPPTTAQLLPATSPTPTLIFDPQLNATYIVDAIGSGNPNLKAQTAKSWLFGIALEPKQGLLSDFRLNIEHYNIVQPDYIALPSAQQIINAPALASRVTRSTATGAITSVDASVINALEYQTKGWDVTLEYERKLSRGSIVARAAGTWVTDDKRQYSLQSPKLDFAGFPNDGGEAKFKGNLSAGWEARRWSVIWTATYFDSYAQAFSPGSPSAIQNGFVGAYATAQGGDRVPSQIYHDIVGSYAFRDSDVGNRVVRSVFNGLKLQVGIKNMFNTLPPLDAASVPYYYSPYGDPRLRQVWVALKKTF